MFRFKNKTLSMLLFIVIVAVVAIFAVLFGIFGKLQTMETSTKYTKSNYAIGTISTTSGKTLESNQNIYTKEMNKIENATIKLTEDASITYKVFYYDEDKAFISASNSLSRDYADALDTEVTPATDPATYEATTPANAVYFRVVITPALVDGESVYLASSSDMVRYINQISIVIAK